MADQRDALRDESAALAAALSAPDVAKNPRRLGELSKQKARLDERLAVLNELAELQAKLPELRQLAAGTEADLAELAKAELVTAEPRLAELEAQAEELARPRDPNDDRPAMIEIRAGAGGDEASLFAGELYGMYHRYAEAKGRPVEVFSQSASEAGGYKEIIFRVAGEGAFGDLRFEGGTHRVQRVPVTESSGRVHTSTATVAVLPEAEEVEVDLPQQDIRVDVFRSSGPGGQSVNTTDSAVRITHMPTNITVSCQDEKSQHKNRARAMTILRTRLKEHLEAEAAQQRGDTRRAQVGSGDRSEKIRTYNFPQDRLTDHRIGFTTHGLPKILGGGLDPVITALRAAARETDA